MGKEESRKKSNQNLKPFNTLCTEDAKAIRSAGGFARAEAIKERKLFQEAILLALSLPDEANPEQNNLTAMVASLVREAKAGNVKALEVARDTIGEKPKDRIEQDINTFTPIKIEFVE